MSEIAIRREFKKQGYTLQKSRARTTTHDNEGGYNILDAHTGNLQNQGRYEMSLDEVLAFSKS